LFQKNQISYRPLRYVGNDEKIGSQIIPKNPKYDESAVNGKFVTFGSFGKLEPRISALSEIFNPPHPENPEFPDWGF
jgi:hypothetical protein